MLSAIAAMYLLTFGFHAFGQTNATPTISPNNIEFIPQKAFIVTVPPAGQEQTVSSNTNTNNDANATNQGGVAGAIIGAVSLAGVAYNAFKNSKTQKNQQNIAETQVKLAGAHKSALELQYENMPQKGNEITNRPDIKLENLEKIKEEALKNASKA